MRGILFYFSYPKLTLSFPQATQIYFPLNRQISPLYLLYCTVVPIPPTPPLPTFLPSLGWSNLSAALTRQKGFSSKERKGGIEAGFKMFWQKKGFDRRSREEERESDPMEDCGDLTSLSPPQTA